MKALDRTAQILNVRGRGSRSPGWIRYQVETLQSKWLESRTSSACTPDFYIVRISTLLEVFTRRNLGELVDHADKYTERAVELSKHFKMDFSLVRDIQGRTITIGDVVAHSIPLNSFDQIIGCFEAILGRDIRPLVCAAVDRWAVEIEKENDEPIVGDFDSVAARLARLFEVRHILCHELPDRPPYKRSEIDEFFDAAIRFTKAMQEVLTFERFGLVPLTQSAMNMRSFESLHEQEQRMEAVLSELRSVAENVDKMPSPGPPEAKEDTWLKALNDSQRKWLQFREAHCHFETYLSLGGTIRPLLWNVEAERLTKARTADLQSFLESQLERLDTARSE